MTRYRTRQAFWVGSEWHRVTWDHDEPCLERAVEAKAKELGATSIDGFRHSVHYALHEKASELP